MIFFEIQILTLLNLSLNLNSMSHCSRPKLLCRIRSTVKWTSLFLTQEKLGSMTPDYNRCKFFPKCGNAPHFHTHLIGEIPWRRKRQLTPVFLPGKSHGRRSLVGYSPWGRKESDKTEAILHTRTASIRDLLHGSVVKNSPAMQELQKMQFQSLGWEDPKEEETATHSSILAWRIPWTVEPGMLQYIRSHRMGDNWNDWAPTPCTLQGKNLIGV